MAEEYVKREEFDILKKDVEKIKDEMTENAKTLQSIDKKIDVITERLINADKIDDLKLNPIEKRVSKLEDNLSWVWRAFGGALIAIAVKVVFDISTYIK